MENTFCTPQRQSLFGIVVLFFSTMQNYIRALWPILIIWIVKFNEANKLYLVLGTLLVLAVVGFISFLKYQNFTFYIDVENDEFVISEGILNKTKTSIQLNKIQQVSINQSFIQRIVGVYELEVDTAGSNKKEGKINAISHSLALSLKVHLLNNEQKLKSISAIELGATEEVVQSPILFIGISLISLIKVGITSSYFKSFSFLLLFFLTASDYINKFTGRDILNDDAIEEYVNKSVVLTSLAVFLVLLFGVVIVINLFRVVVRYFNYKITKQSGSLLLSFGLVNTKSTILKPEKVQITTISRNYFQKKMNVLEMKIKQATGGEKQKLYTAIEIPGCNNEEKDEILKFLFNQIPQKGYPLQPNYRKLVFAVFLVIILPLLVFYTVAYNVQAVMKFVYLTPVYATFVGMILYFGFLNYRMFISNNFIIKQSGAWDIKDEIIAIEKIQAITTSQLFWHKKADIGYLTLHTAGGSIGFQLGNYTSIKQYVNLWLYKIETSNSNWM